MHQSGLHLYVFTLERDGGGGQEGEGKPLCDIIPHARARFVSLADFCRLTPKHPWTLPPPFTFNLYQSIQPSRRIERTNMHETGRMRCGRHRVLFTADSAFILLFPFAAWSVRLFHRVSPSLLIPFRPCVPFVASYPKQTTNENARIVNYEISVFFSYFPLPPPSPHFSCINVFRSILYLLM